MKLIWHMGSCLTADERENSNRRKTWSMKETLQELETDETRFAQRQENSQRGEAPENRMRGATPGRQGRKCVHGRPGREREKSGFSMSSILRRKESEVNSSRLWSQGGWRKEINNWRMSTQGLEVGKFERRGHSLAEAPKGKKLTWSISAVPLWFKLKVTLNLHSNVESERRCSLGCKEATLCELVVGWK